MHYNLDLNKKYRSCGTVQSGESAAELLSTLQETPPSEAKAAKSSPGR
jgi:hypothetical protein